MISQFFVLSQRGDSLITRELRGDAGDLKGTHEVFFRKVKNQADCPPVFIVDGLTYCYVKRSGLFFTCTTSYNISPSYVIELLSQFVKVFKDYCGILNEETIRRNYVLIYELLDEMLDFGYAQGTSTENLRAFVFNEAITASPGIAGSLKKFKLPDINPKTTPSTSVFKPIATGDKASRGRNEVFVDIAERITAVFNASGHIINSEIQGCVQMKSYLTGNPELRLALNPDLTVGRGSHVSYGVVLDDCNFHECVQLENFEREKELLLVPPDGEFVAMNYRVTSDLIAPFKLFPAVIEESPYKINLTLRLQACMGDTNYGCNVTVSWPVPKHTTSVSFEKTEGANGQRTDYKSKDQRCSWFMKRIPGKGEVQLRAKIVMSQQSSAITHRELGPFSINFEIPMFNASGVNVKFLEIVQHGPPTKNKPFRWVRYVTHSNSYVVRTS